MKPTKPRGMRSLAKAVTRRHPALVWATRWGAVATSLALTACQPAVLDPQGPVGRAEKAILFDSVAIMLVIVIPTICATLLFAWWFRESNAKARRLPDWAYSGQIELVTWSIPLMTITLLGGVAWIGSHELDPGRPLASKADALDVQVVSLDWKWLFIYPGQRIAAVNELVIPAGTPVRFSLTSASVMNAFFIPQLGSMIYTMNGMTTELNLEAEQPGTFRGISSHFSGDGFSDMHFEVRAVSPDDFAAWVTATRGAGTALDAGSYALLAVQSIKVSPFTFRETDPGLFQKIVGQDLPPGPGPLDQTQAAKPKPVHEASAGSRASGEK